MLYGYLKENELVTVVVAATTMTELDAFRTTLEASTLYLCSYTTSVVDRLTDDQYRGLPVDVTEYTHETKEQQEQFIHQHDIIIVSRARSIDRANDMLAHEEPDPYDVEDERTIEEIHNLTEHDPYDVRTEEEKVEDAAMREQIRKMKEKDQISDESFAPRKDNDKGTVGVTSIKSSVGADGSINIDKVTAIKYGGEVDEGVKKEVVAEPEITIPNAKLTLKFGDHIREVDVCWSGKKIAGADDLSHEVYFSEEYRLEWANRLEPKFTVESYDHHYKSDVVYVEMFCMLATEKERDECKVT